jgi:aminopeptidase N
MRCSLVLLLVLIAACGGGGDDGGDDAPVTGDIQADITHYDYTFDVDTRMAHASVTAHVTQAGNCLTLPFRAQSPKNAMLGGEAATTTFADNTLESCNTNGVHEGDTTLEMDVAIPEGTLSTSQVGFSKQVDNGNAFYYLVSWVNGCDKFGPCDSRPNLFATYTFHVTHPATHMVACPGVITETSDTETDCDFTLPGGPTYSTFGVAAYPRALWVKSDKGMWGSVHATVYAAPTTLVDSKIDSAHHNAYVTWMESTFGPFPFGSELRVLAAPTYWSGFEHPGNIVLDNSLGRATTPYAHPAQHVLDHEIAHQWAGDQTTLKGTYDFVWKESMAEYLAYSYEAMTEPTAANVTARYWKSASATAQFYPVPGEMPALFDYYSDVYGPGPMILFHQIEALTSRDQVIAALKMVLGQPHAIGVDDVVAALEASTGLDLTAYAAAWIHGTGAPVWPVATATFAASSLHVVISGGTEKRCKFHVRLSGAGVSDTLDVPVDTFHDGIDQTIPVTPTFAVTSTTIDPLTECLVFDSNANLRVGPRVHPWLSPSGLASLPN